MRLRCISDVALVDDRTLALVHQGYISGGAEQALGAFLRYVLDADARGFGNRILA
jgi:hypothetical protein